jgi:hypothetical protein
MTRTDDIIGTLYRAKTSDPACELQFRGSGQAARRALVDHAAGDHVPPYRCFDGDGCGGVVVGRVLIETQRRTQRRGRERGVTSVIAEMCAHPRPNDQEKSTSRTTRASVSRTSVIAAEECTAATG